MKKNGRKCTGIIWDKNEKSKEIKQERITRKYGLGRTS